MILRTVIFNLFVLLVCQGAMAQSKHNTKLEAVYSLVKKNKFNGSLLLSENGSILLAEGFGHQNLEKDIKNNPQTVFDIGSLTKQFTAAAILKLESQYNLSVDDPISKYFPDVPSQMREITIHNLLTHSAGFPGAIGSDYDIISKEEFVKSAFESNRFQAGKTGYEYSNVGYSLLALIVESVSGQSFEAFLRNKILLPAGMEQTGYLLPEWEDNQVAVGYKGDDDWGQPHRKGWQEGGISLHLLGNGGLLSTIEDLHKWDQVLRENIVLSNAAKEKYFHPHIKEYADGSSYYGYGWVIMPTRRNTTLITHNGGNGVFFADFLRFVDDGFTVILMSNQANGKTEELAWRIAKQWF